MAPGTRGTPLGISHKSQGMTNIFVNDETALSFSSAPGKLPSIKVKNIFPRGRHFE